MKYELMNAVILAEDYEKLKAWYMEALDLELKQEWTEKFHYAELVKDGRFVVGIGLAKEMGVTPGDRKAATVYPQFNTDDTKALLAQVKERGGEVPFGPSYDEGLDLWYGGFADIEGNQCWVVQMPQLMSGS